MCRHGHADNTKCIHSSFAISYLPITYFVRINYEKVTDTVTNSLLLWINKSYCTDGPVRIAQKLPIRNSWELVSESYRIPLPIFHYFELIW